MRHCGKIICLLLVLTTANILNNRFLKEAGRFSSSELTLLHTFCNRFLLDYRWKRRHFNLVHARSFGAERSRFLGLCTVFRGAVHFDDKMTSNSLVKVAIVMLGRNAHRAHFTCWLTNIYLVLLKSSSVKFRIDRKTSFMLRVWLHFLTTNQVKNNLTVRQTY